MLLSAPGWNRLTVAAAAAVVIGTALWFGANSEERDVLDRTGAAYLARFDMKEETTGETAALGELFQQSRHTRAAFLRAALMNTDGARRLIAHQQGFTVALSRVDQDEAMALFQSALELALRASADPDVLRAAVLLSNRWSIGKAMRGKDRTELLTAIVARLVEAENHQLRSALVPAVAEFAIDAPSSLATQVAERMPREHAPSTISVLASALMSLEANANEASADQLATLLVRRIVEERSIPAMRAVAPALEPLKAKVSARTAGELAGALVNRAASEINPSAMDALRTALETFTSKLAVKHANDLAPIILQRMALEQDAVMLATLAWTFTALGEHVGASHVEHGADRMLTRMSGERDPVSLAVLTSGLSAFGRAREGKFEAAAARVVDAMLEEQDAYKMSILASALKIIPSGRLDERKATALAARLSVRRAKEWNIPALLPLDVAIGVLKRDDDEAPEKPPETQPGAKPAGACTPARTSSQDQRAVLSRQILSPACDEESWVELVRALGEIIGRPLVKDTAAQVEDDAPDFDQLNALSDDADGADSKNAARPEIDFAALSTTVNAFRPALAATRYDWARRAAVVVLIIGLVVFAARARASTREMR